MDCPTCNGTGHRAGARECFVPRPGNVFYQADYPQLELYTLAQLCMSWCGESKLARALLAGRDPHLEVAALILKISYEEAAARLHAKDPKVKQARGGGKVVNFGAPGGLGADSLVSYAKTSYKISLTTQEAKDLLSFWEQAWPEMRAYKALANRDISPATKRASVTSLHTNRTRGGMTYCQRCNTPFQGLGADCARLAGCWISRAQTAEPWSPLYGTHTVFMIHDEYILEGPEDDRVHDRAMALVQIMVSAANTYLTHVPIDIARMQPGTDASPIVMRFWSKDAQAVVGPDGKLIPWG